MSKTLMLGKIEGKSRRGWQRMRWLDSITGLMGMNLGKFLESEGWGALVSLHGDRRKKSSCCSPWGDKESAGLSNRTKTTTFNIYFAYWRADKCK